MPDDKPLADYASPALSRADDHPAWNAPDRAPLRRGSRVPNLRWKPGTRLVTGDGQPPICPYAAGIDVSELGPCPLDAEDPAAAAEEIGEKSSADAANQPAGASEEVTSAMPAAAGPAPAGE